ncbi:centrosomal protein of 131 kDa-like [Pecten maximus]|uniref:centrosomal protein of 131 kDa-like n=1 Tax=Pecten maximus TaxID=6579 RepID=UPI0014581E8A|nr:centrosomal protein of 131 kDa-like [Pecten maximus]
MSARSSSRSKARGEDVNLSLTGSQISSIRKSSSSRQSNLPGDKKGPNKETSRSSTHPKKNSGDAPNLSDRSQKSAVSAVSRASSKKGKSPGEDFLALFETSMQPKIKSASKQKQPSPNAVKVLWQEAPHKGELDSQRSTNSTQRVNNGGSGLLSPTMQQNFFQPSSIHSSSDSDDGGILSSSLNKIQSLQRKSHAAKSDSFKNKKPKEKTRPSRVNTTDSAVNHMNGVNGIANNMVTSVKSPRTKASLSSIENSYQNIKHKTPVNQVKEGLANHRFVSSTEEYVQTLTSAAIKIQRWYRKICVRRKRNEAVQMAGEAAIKRLLGKKKKDIEEHKLDLDFLDEEDRKIEERRKIRDDKAKQARQQAIQELQKKREEKRDEVKQKAEAEISYLQASGKITKTPAKANIGRKKSPTKSFGNTLKDNNVDRDAQANGKSARSAISDVKTMSARSQEGSEEFIESASSVNQMDSSRNSDTHTLTERSQGYKGPDSEVTNKSTLNDLLETLKKLEEEEHLVTPKPEKKNAWLDDLEKVAQSSEKDVAYLTADKLQELNRPRDGGAASGYLSDDKLKSIMSFLDEVQVADRISAVEQEISKASEDFDRPVPLVPSVDELAELEHAQEAANEVTSTVLSQRLELDEKKRTVSMLQKALNQQRELTVRHAKETDKEMKKRLEIQKDEYEEAIKRHLSFIDQLIDDKKSLSERCEQLVKELKTVDRKYQDKFRSMDDKHSIEMKKLKDMHEAAEKLRRERWIEDKTKKIKEMTVKGLEPEIQRLIAKHKNEFKKMKQIHEAELLESDERAAQRYVKMTEELRDQLAQEKEAACARERELAKQRYEKELQNEEEAYQQQRRRLYTEVQEEKDRVAQQASRQRTDLDKLQRQLEDSHRHALNAMKSEFEKAREEQERRHNEETTDIKEKVKIEKEQWEENYRKKQDTWIMQKERELRDQVKRDRDKEIELVISRLEDDATSSREDCERTAENKIKRIREKYQTEMKDLERSEMQALEKYNEMKAKLTEVEGENECLKVYLKQKDQEIAQLQQLTDKMHKERDRVSDIIRQEFADRLVTTDEENRRIKNEMSEMKARHRIELDRAKDQIEEVKKRKDDEMEEVHKRVKQAIVKKEEVLNQVRQQYQASQKRADHLEGLLQQQRKQLLNK